MFIALLVLITGVSYSAWRYVFSGNENRIETGSLSLKLLESNTNIIDLKNELPKSDEEGMKQNNTFDFSVITKATYNTKMGYDIKIEKLNVDTGYTSLNNDQIKIYLTDYNDKVLVNPTLISDLPSSTIYSRVNEHTPSKTEEIDKYKIRVWIDKDVDASSWTKDTKNQYKFKIGLKNEEIKIVEPNAPVLDSSMIPVYYDEISETWKKADESNSDKDYKWYDYNNKMWANSVTVSSINREKYLSAENGTTIPMDDILTMQVWIPRYKYKVWNYSADGTKKSEPQEIEITWEDSTASTGEITCTDNMQGENGDGTSEVCKLKSTNATCTDSTCNNKTYTHPAFTFGDEEIKGFWIGKFELTGTISSITTKPDLTSLRNQNVSTFETNIMNMKNSGNSYGLSTTTDTHMIKNMEWGAVAYLSHSKYGTCDGGTCKEVGINNNSGYKTGCGDEAGSGSSSTCNSYNTTLGQKASTTNNIYGVYDMSGGAKEYTMANVVDFDGTKMVPSYSGYTTTTYPDVKYYDKYSYSKDASIRLECKLGDALKEVNSASCDYCSWYGNHSYNAEGDNPWPFRGGNYEEAGMFVSSAFWGYGDLYYSSRLIITL